MKIQNSMFFLLWKEVYMGKVIKIRMASECSNLIKDFKAYKKDMKKEQLRHNFLANSLDKIYNHPETIKQLYLDIHKISAESFFLLTIINNKRIELLETKLFFDKWGTGTLMIFYREKDQEKRKPLMVYRVIDTLNELDETYIEIDKYGLTYYCSSEEAKNIFRRAQKQEVIKIGTIKIKNLSTLSNASAILRVAAMLGELDQLKEVSNYEVKITMRKVLDKTEYVVTDIE